MRLGRSAMTEDWFHAAYPPRWIVLVMLGLVGAACGQETKQVAEVDAAARPRQRARLLGLR